MDFTTIILSVLMWLVSVTFIIWYVTILYGRVMGDSEKYFKALLISVATAWFIFVFIAFNIEDPYMYDNLLSYIFLLIIFLLLDSFTRSREKANISKQDEKTIDGAATDDNQ